MSKCGKRRFRDRIGAEFALTQVKDDNRREKKQQRTYRCPACKGWHLTSQVGVLR